MQSQSIDLLIPSVVTVEQFARALQVSPATLRRWHASGLLPVSPLRVGRRMLFPLGPVQALLEKKTTHKN